MAALKALVILLSVFAFATIGYNAAVNMPKSEQLRREAEAIPSPPSSRALDPMLSATERKALWLRETNIVEEYNRKKDQANERFYEVRDRRDLYSASATGIGILTLLLSIVATSKQKKGLLVLGALTAVLSGLAWVVITISADGHL